MDDRVEFGREQDTDMGGNQRGAGRDSMFLQTIITHDDGRTEPTRVRNLSAGGMMVDISRPVPIGTPITAELRGLGILRGQIAWCANGKAGVAFAVPVDPKLARKGAVSSGAGMMAVPIVTRSRRPPIRTI